MAAAVIFAVISLSYITGYLSGARELTPALTLSFPDVLRPEMASMATRALNSGLWVLRVVNSFEEGFAYGGESLVGAVPRLRG
jgi:hypothetical protein